jgi:CDGSH-type Zn-finger protein
MPDRCTIQTEANGPYVVTGPATILDADGNAFEVAEGHTVKLCRCGHSAKKPFCDSTHRRVDFVSRPAFVPEPQEPRPAG